MIINKEKATLGGGCFWCLEAVYRDVKGVVKVRPGYAGGEVKAPSYEEVCTGNTGHAEVVQIEFEPDCITYNEILNIFFFIHDPTTLNRQGADIGSQYRSVIFYHSAGQKEMAQHKISSLEEENIYEEPFVTQVLPYENFFPAEDYHRDYYVNNRDESYCQLVISPKVAKFRKKYMDKLKG